MRRDDARALYICNFREEIFMRFQRESIPTLCNFRGSSVSNRPKWQGTSQSVQLLRYSIEGTLKRKHSNAQLSVIFYLEAARIPIRHVKRRRKNERNRIPRRHQILFF